ncbi:MAG: hypothetical protein ACLURP_02135 [Ruminococcus sp.]
MINGNWLLVVIGAVLLAGYLGGFLYILFGDANVDLNPIHCMAAGWTSTGGRMWILVLCSGAFLSYGTCDLSGK